MRARASAHLRDNLWLWIGIFLVATLAAGFMRYMTGGGRHWGDVVALCGIIAGGLIMVKAQEGAAHSDAEDAEVE